MEDSWTNWLCDLEPNDYSFINQSSINAEFVSSTESNFERPSKLLKTTTTTYSSNHVKTEHLAQKTASYILSFENENPPQKTKVVTSKNGPRRVKNHESNKKNGSFSKSTTHQTPDHIIAERIRREKISQQLIALSALIPNLKKMDKASVLGGTIKYVKELKEQVKVLEEQSKRKNLEPVVVVKKLSQLSADEDVSDTSSNSCNENSDETSKTNLFLPEVEARLSGKNVLIRILCEKDKTVMVNVYREIEKLHLSVINASCLSFGSSVLAITIIAQMEDELNMSMQKLAKKLKVGLVQFN